MRLAFIFLLLFTHNLISQNTKGNHFYDLSFTTLSGEQKVLSEFKGKKILIVNTASKCGFTPQYKQLEELYQRYKDNLIIIGFPSNDFKNQEPGTNQEIAEFCERNYGVTFLMAEKIHVTGENMHPIYQWLTQKKMNKVKDSRVKWNFQKYLIDEKGQLIDVFESAVTPLSAEITGLL